jgi:hypothetical protein
LSIILCTIAIMGLQRLAAFGSPLKNAVAE